MLSLKSDKFGCRSELSIPHLRPFASAGWINENGLPKAITNIKTCRIVKNNGHEKWRKRVSVRTLLSTGCCPGWSISFIIKAFFNIKNSMCLHKSETFKKLWTKIYSLKIDFETERIKILIKI